MKKSTLAILFSIICGLFSFHSSYAGPFGIDMGMSLADLKDICKATPKHLEDNLYEITPPNTHQLFERYVVRVDSDYGVYWLKAIGKDIYTNDHGDRLRGTFNTLVESISKTYGEESYKEDGIKEGITTALSDPRYFMHTLLRGDRELYAIWSREFDLTIKILSHPYILDKIASIPEPEMDDIMGDETAVQVVTEIVEQYSKLPVDIPTIGVFAKALTSSSGYVAVEYTFSNQSDVEEKADSVF